MSYNCHLSVCVRDKICCTYSQARQDTKHKLLSHATKTLYLLRFERNPANKNANLHKLEAESDKRVAARTAVRKACFRQKQNSHLTKKREALSSK